MSKDCKSVKCYNEVNKDNEYCFDCLNRQAEDKAYSMTVKKALSSNKARLQAEGWKPVM